MALTCGFEWGMHGYDDAGGLGKLPRYLGGPVERGRRAVTAAVGECCVCVCVCVCVESRWAGGRACVLVGLRVEVASEAAEGVTGVLGWLI